MGPSGAMPSFPPALPGSPTQALAGLQLGPTLPVATPCNTLFVANLGSYVTEQELREVFGKWVWTAVHSNRPSSLVFFSVKWMAKQHFFFFLLGPLLPVIEDRLSQIIGYSSCSARKCIIEKPDPLWVWHTYVSLFATAFLLFWQVCWLPAVKTSHKGCIARLLCRVYGMKLPNQIVRGVCVCVGRECFKDSTIVPGDHFSDCSIFLQVKTCRKLSLCVTFAVLCVCWLVLMPFLHVLCPCLGRGTCSASHGKPAGVSQSSSRKRLLDPPTPPNPCLLFCQILFVFFSLFSFFFLLIYSHLEETCVLINCKSWIFRTRRLPYKNKMHTNLQGKSENPQQLAPVGKFHANERS